MTYANDNESLCCNARIDEQFARCTDCLGHAEPTRFTDGEIVKTDYRGMIVNNNAIVIDDGSTHCTECFSGSQDTNFGYGDVAIPEGCKDEDCECHGPLVDESGRPLTTESFRERFTRDFNFEVNDAVGLIFLAVPILMLCLISFLAEGK